MAVIDDTTLAGLADLAEELALKDDCLIQRDGSNISGYPIDLSDGYGTEIEALVTIGTVKSLTMAPNAGQLAPYAEKIGSLTSWKVLLPLGTDVQEGDILTILAQRMEVQAVLSPQTFSVFTVVLASEIKP